jgi:hypothetical protein
MAWNASSTKPKVQADLLTGEAALSRPIKLALVAVSLALPMGAAAKDSLGIFGDWGAFRDPGNTRCYAIAQPEESSGGRGFASVGFWPKAGVRTQFQARFGANAVSATVTIGGQTFRLATGGNNGWAADKRMDAAIVAAMRSASSMRVQSRSTSGGLLTDVYRLRGAASAIDAAALGCVRR